MLAAPCCSGKYLARVPALITLNFGIPQNRSRVCIVGVLRAEMPAGQTCRAGSAPATPGGLERGSARRPFAHGTTTRAWLQQRRQAYSPAESPRGTRYGCGIADRGTWINKPPCLTRTRCGENGYWVNSPALGQRGMLTAKELLRLQGLPESLIGTVRAANVTDRPLLSSIGNAMPMNVVACVSRLTLKAIGHA